MRTAPARARGPNPSNGVSKWRWYVRLQFLLYTINNGGRAVDTLKGRPAAEQGVHKPVKQFSRCVFTGGRKQRVACSSTK